MQTRRWHRISARIVLATFTPVFVACGPSQPSAPTTTTTAPPVETPTTLAPPPSTVPPPPPPAAPPPPPTIPSQAPAQLDKQGLRDLVAPVALYPDVVLSSLLPATNNPDQIHDAAAYVGQAQHVDNVPTDRGWDGAVVGLLQFPDVLRWLDANPAWTDQMGQAVTYQQGDVLQAIQDYRKTAQDVGNLKSNQYQKVEGGGGQDIRIEPARQDVVYVPSYDPVAATQPQPPPAPGVNPWIAFGGGAVVGALGAWALYSVFSDHDHDHGDYYHGGNRKIVNYNNYYYSGGRRPQGTDWQPQQRQFNRARGANGNWQRPGRLQQTAQPGGVRPQQAALRPPMSAPGATGAGTPPPTPRQVQREQRQQRQAEQQQRQQQQREQKQTERQQRQDANRQRQDQQRQQKQERRQQQQTDQAQRRQQQQDQRQQRREQKQENQAKQREERQTERQQNKAAKQERQQERQQQRQENKAQQQQQKKNKKNH